MGIGTTSPTKQLQVVGATQLGSVAITDSLIINKNVRIKDSLRVQKKLLVGQDVKIMGKTVMTGNVRAKANLTVMGNSRTKGNGVVEGNANILGVTKMRGNAFVDGFFKFKGLADSTITGTRLLTIRPNGKVESFNKISFASEIYSLACLATSNNQFSPIWTNSNGTINPLTHGVIYAGASNCYPTWVGIGTDSPVAHFHTQGNGYFSGDLGLGTPPSGSAKLTIEDSSLSRSGILINLPNTTQSANTGVGIKVITNNNLRKAMTVVDGNTNQDVFRVYGNGKLEIKSNAASSLDIITTGNNNACIALKSGNDQSDLLFYDSNNSLAGVLRFGIKNGEGFLSFDDRTSGSVVEKFRVGQNGVVYAHEIKVTLGPFADYVFEKDYNLLGFKALNNYIEQEGHLPNMPSAQEVDENGIGVGELQIKLLEKVEELTLYILQLEKRINKLETK